MNASRGASLSNTVPCSSRRRPAPYSAHAYFMQWVRACVSRRRYRGIARRDAQPVSSSVNNHTSTSRAAARKAMIAAHLGLTLDLPPPLLFTSLCTCRVLPGYGCRQQGLLSASVSAAVSPPHLQHIPDRLGCVHTPVQIFLFCAFAIYAERGLPV